MSKTSIEWTEMTWNPTTGCNKVSDGCKFCYAEVLSRRLQGYGNRKYKNGFDLTLHPDTLNLPYAWSRPTVVFVNSMSDLFHENIPLDYIKKVFKVMSETPMHTYQILTKRAEILLEYNKHLNWTKNIWMGVSVENEKVLTRIDFLRKTDANIKFLSLEPLLAGLPNLNLKNIDWVIVGGESGPNARIVRKSWILDIRKKCKKQNVPFFFKQWGRIEFNVDRRDPTIKKNHPYHAKGGCRLDGKIYREMPSKNGLGVGLG